MLYRKIVFMKRNYAIQTTPITRRTTLQVAAASLAGASCDGLFAANPANFPPVRTITRGPKFHWFGYYDKLQFDPTSRYALGMELGFEHRSPTGDDVIKVGIRMVAG